MGWVVAELDDCACGYLSAAEVKAKQTAAEPSVEEKEMFEVSGAMLQMACTDAKAFASHLKDKKEEVLKKNEEWTLVGSCRGVTDVANKLELAAQGMTTSSWDCLLLATWLSETASQMAEVLSILDEADGLYEDTDVKPVYEAERITASGLVGKIEAVMDKVEGEATKDRNQQNWVDDPGPQAGESDPTPPT